MSDGQCWLLGGAALLVFLGLAGSVEWQMSSVLRVDLFVRHLFQEDAGRFSLGIARAVSEVGSLPVLTVLVLSVALLHWRRRGDPRSAAVVLAGFAGTVLVVNLVKRVVGRPRPGLLDAAGPLNQGDLSFPSGHVANTAFLLGLCLIALADPWASRGRRVLRWTCLMVLEGVVMWSRLALDEHWLSDVVGSLLLATALVCAAAPFASSSASWHDRPGSPGGRPRPARRVRISRSPTIRH